MKKRPSIVELLIMLLFIVGFGLNGVVTITNGGKLPVATKDQDVYFAVGAFNKMDYPYPEKEYFDTQTSRQPLTESTQYAFLADRFAYSLEYPMFEFVPNNIRYALGTVGIPVGSHLLASLGDIILWVMFWIAVPFAALKRINKRKVQRNNEVP